MNADAPALGRLLDGTTEGVGQQLMAEADADELAAIAGGGPAKVLQRRHPGQAIVNAVGAAGDEVGIALGRACRQLALESRVVAKVVPRSATGEKRAKHFRQIAVASAQLGRDPAGLQQSYTHASPPFPMSGAMIGIRRR